MDMGRDDGSGSPIASGGHQVGSPCSGDSDGKCPLQALGVSVAAVAAAGL